MLRSVCSDYYNYTLIVSQSKHLKGRFEAGCEPSYICAYIYVHNLIRAQCAQAAAPVRSNHQLYFESVMTVNIVQLSVLQLNLVFKFS